jgi:hypothetical protein
MKLIIKTNLLPDWKRKDLLDECTQLCNIIGKSIVTARANRDAEKKKRKDPDDPPNA